MLGPASLLMVLLLLLPLALLFRDSLNRFDPTELMIEAVTPANYLRFFADPFYRAVLITTIRVSRHRHRALPGCSACRWPGVSRAPPAGGNPRWWC